MNTSLVHRASYLLLLPGSPKDAKQEFTTVTTMMGEKTVTGVYGVATISSFSELRQSITTTLSSSTRTEEGGAIVTDHPIAIIGPLGATIVFIGLSMLVVGK